MNITKNNFEKYEKEILDILNGIVNFEKYSKEINRLLSKIINENLYDVDYLLDDEEKIDNIYSDLKYYVNENISDYKTNEIINEIREFYQDYNLQNLENLLIAIENNNIDEFVSYKNKLLNEIKIINQFNNIKKLNSSLVNDKKMFIHNFIYKMSEDERNFFMINIDNVFKYHYVEKFYLALEEKIKVLPNLYDERNELLKNEKLIISNLIATRGWYYQNKKMNYSISTSLSKWINLKKKLGKGTGRTANLYIRQMREEMNTAKNAIPVWIMPIDKLIEQYPFDNDTPFDVLIMDESSQSSIYSISALARAKKIIIVGDDKQISPTDAFTSLDSLSDLRTKYLSHNKWNLQISKDTSIYDIVQTICGNKKITLTEHFRCLPEIIHYSNKMFYNMEINPLKVRSKENTIAEPIKSLYVVNATCDKKSGQLMNETEMNRIVTLFGDIISDRQYNDKTIGIIVLQKANRYVQKMQQELMTKYGDDVLKERKFKIGTTYDFQGDERDVIILSMVIARISSVGEKNNFRPLTTKEFDRSFNVAASRAKEQMILVHSVKLDDLSPNDNRYKLLDYCMNYNTEKEKNNEELFESNFERDLYYCLTSKGYNLIPQFKVGNYRIDFVLTNNNNQKIAIECDGDSYHGINELENDLKRQSILERCGWKFARIRASEFYYDRDKSIKNLINLIEHYLNGNNSILFYNENNNEISENVKDNNIIDYNYSKKYDEIYENRDEAEHLKKKTIVSDIIKNLDNPLTDEENIIKKFGPSQFKYMTLFSIGVTRKEIAKYYNVAYDTVKKSLQEVCNKYNYNSAIECISYFKEQWKNNSYYKKIIIDYREYNNKNNDSKKVNIDNIVTDFIEKEQNKCTGEYITNIVLDAIAEEKNIKIKYSNIRKEYSLLPKKTYDKDGAKYLKAIDLESNTIKVFKYEKIFDIELL